MLARTGTTKRWEDRLPHRWRRLMPAAVGTSTWLVHLRFLAVIGQFWTIVAAAVFVGGGLPVGALLTLVAVTAITNVAYAWWLQRRAKDLDLPDRTVETATDRSEDAEGAGVGSRSDQKVILFLMSLDLLTLTAMLHLSGGVDNPFSYFFFVNLAVGGVTLVSSAVWLLTATAIGGYAFLLLASEPLPILFVSAGRPDGWLAIGRIVAFGTCSIVVTYYVTRTAMLSRRRHAEVLAMEQSEQNNRHLRGLTTLAAGAAHELATPLSTIDVVVKELSHHLRGRTSMSVGDDVVGKDLRLIDDELERCRTILGRMRAAAGAAAAERFRQTTVGDLIDAMLEGIRQPARIDIEPLSDASERTPLWVPTETVAQSLRNLVHNALDASDPSPVADGSGWVGPAGEPRDCRVRVEVAVDDSSVTFRVVDCGHGMTAEEVTRIAEPFYTTKPPGRGMGLGLYLTHNVIDQLGGELSFQSDRGCGTTATVRLPRQNRAMVGLSG